MAESSIEWCDVVWNVTRGCSRVSLGCGGAGRVGGCYAERQAMRFSGPGQPYEGLVRQTANGPRWTGRVELIPSKLDEPLRWRDARPKLGRPLRVFVNSMSDLFHEALPWGDIARVMDVIVAAKRHTFQVLTKRPQRMLDFFAELGSAEGLEPPPNLWLGVSVEDQATADERIPLLLQTPAAVRFVSYEPGLGPVHLDTLAEQHGGPTPCCGRHGCEKCDGTGTAHGIAIHWVIVGGESGPGARPFDVAWARSVVAQCEEAGIACFVKQLGARPVEYHCASGKDCTHPDCGNQLPKLKSPKGGDMSEWPEDLRIREFPRQEG